MVLNPGASVNKYKQCYIRQKSLSNYGRVFYGSSSLGDAAFPPSEHDITLTYGRNLLYVLFLIQNPVEVSTSSSAPALPAFKLDISTRASYYDN